MFKTPALVMLLCLPHFTSAQTVDPLLGKTSNGKPAIIATVDLDQFDSLPVGRRKLIQFAIAVASESPWLPYTARGSVPADGGFDCSGAMYFVMRRAGLDPPRTSAAQLQWVKQNGGYYKVPFDAVSLAHPGFKHLLPGDLLFWGRPGSVADGTKTEITHVAMFLGYEKKDNLPVMINSTDGRSYRGIKANGYGVYDFRLPHAGSKIAFIGYGSPPGIPAIN